MDSHFQTQLRQILSGNVLLILCCFFYLAWWIAAFHPGHEIKGIRSGWLLIPAAVFGVWAVVQILKGCLTGDVTAHLLPGAAVAVGGIAAYLILLLVTTLLLKRQVTTELLLIVGWTVLMMFEFSTLYGMGAYTRRGAAALCIAVAAAAALCLVCYLLYYTLDARKGYWDGMIPLVLAAVMMAAISVPLISRFGF